MLSTTTLLSPLCPFSFSIALSSYAASAVAVFLVTALPVVFLSVLVLSSQLFIYLLFSTLQMYT